MSLPNNPSSNSRQLRLALLAWMWAFWACGVETPTQPASSAASVADPPPEVSPQAPANPSSEPQAQQVAAATGPVATVGPATAPEAVAEPESTESGEAQEPADLPIADLAQDTKAEEDEPVPTAKEIAEDAASKSTGPDKDRKQLSDEEMLDLLDEDDLSQDEFENAFKDRKKQGVDLPGAPK